MFNKNFVMAIKAKGQVLREFDESVYVPYGSEYTILLKNLSNSRARVTVKIDGEDVLDGNSLILTAKESLELKRFIKNGNMNAGNSFKFIEKTEKIEQYRGNKVDDGLITIEYEFEVLNPGLTRIGQYMPYKNNRSNYPQVGDYGDYYNSLQGSHQVNYLQQISGNTLLAANPSSNYRGLVAKASSSGITAPGAITEQKFTRASTFYGTGEKFSMTLQLQGVASGQVEIKKPVTVTRLKQCSMCGTNVRQVAKFCHECGSSVEIV